MKSIIIAKPLEYNLEIIGEKWRQGDKVSGSLKLINHGNENVMLPVLKLNLMSGTYKKVKAKDPKAFEEVNELRLSEKIDLSAHEEKSFPFEFNLPEDVRITDKDGSVYLAYLDSFDKAPVGNLELSILPKLMLSQFLEIMDNFLRFKIGPMKFNKGMVEVKLTPPASKEFSQVDALVLRMKESEKSIILEYHFTNRKIEMVGSSMSTSKVNSKFDQVLGDKQFYIYGDSVNQDAIIESVNTILAEVKPKFLY